MGVQILSSKQTEGWMHLQSLCVVHSFTTHKDAKDLPELYKRPHQEKCGKIRTLIQVERMVIIK